MSVAWNSDNSQVVLTAASDQVSGKMQVSAIRWEDAAAVGDTVEIRAGNHASTDRVVKFVCQNAGVGDVMYFPNSLFSDIRIESISSGRIVIIPAPAWM